MDFTVLIHDQGMLDLISGCIDNVALIRDPQVPAPMKDVALEQLTLRLRQLDVLATTIEIERAQ